MADIKTASMNGRPSRTPPVRGFMDQAAEVTGSMIELAELQVQLVKADAKAACVRSITSVVTVVLSGLLMMASWPVLLLGLAGVIAKRLDVDLATMQLVVGTCGLVIAAVCVIIAGRALGKATSAFQRSSEEFSKNVSWIKTLFTHMIRNSRGEK